MQRTIILFLLCLLPYLDLIAGTVSENVATITLLERLNSVDSLQGNFKQQVIENNKVTQQSSGKFYLQRKDRFRWQAQLPTKQLIVSDGHTVWIYDEELEQVSVKAVDGNSQSTPIFLLNASQATIEKHYHISSITKQNQIIYHLVPNKNQDNGYSWIDLTYTNNKLSKIELKDKLEQITCVYLTDVKINSKLSQELFSFIPPKGVDVVH